MYLRLVNLTFDRMYVYLRSTSAGIMLAHCARVPEFVAFVRQFE